MKEFGIEVNIAKRGAIKLSRSLPGEVVFNPNRIAHVMPRVPGVVRKVFAGVGDQVQQGELLAVLDSRELAKAKSEYLSALAQLDLAEANFKRKQSLWQQNITPESEYLAAKQALQAARVAKQLAKWALYALGLSKAEVAQLPTQTAAVLTRYELRAPISGTIVERHAIAGELLSEDTAEPPFVAANLNNVWVQLTVHPKDLTAVQPGQKILITGGGADLEAAGRIAYVSPSLSESTRTATARVVLENADGRWRPGLFVAGRVQTGAAQGEVIVSKAALQTLEGQTVIFVQTPEGFEPRAVQIGQSDQRDAQVLSGLRPGEQYVSAGAFTLKAEMTKEALGGNEH
jgi:cobalt-zinc-cadmium efflux system membrane fusion protein